MKKAGLLKRSWVFLQSILLTLGISVITILEVSLGIFYREKGDQRLRWWARKIVECFGFEYKVYYPKEFALNPDKPCIIMSNHSSLLDIPVTYMALPGSIRMIAKKELFEVPIWGRGLEVSEFVRMDRNNKRQAVRDLQAAREKMESGITLWIAPEGTRSATGNLQPFKKGGFRLAMETGAIIIPVGIRGTGSVLPPGTWDLHEGIRVEVHVGQPIETGSYTKQNSHQLMEDVARQIKELAALTPSSDSSPEICVSALNEPASGKLFSRA